MNKKRLIGYVLVMLSVTSIHAQETNASTQEYKLGMTVPHRYGRKPCLWAMAVWELWYMEYRVQNKYN